MGLEIHDAKTFFDMLTGVSDASWRTEPGWGGFLNAGWPLEAGEVSRRHVDHWEGPYDAMCVCYFFSGREVSLFVCLFAFCLFVLVRTTRLGKDLIVKHLLLYVAELCYSGKKMFSYVFFVSIGFPSIGPYEECHCWSNMITMIIWSTVTCLPGCLGVGFALIFCSHITSIRLESFLPIWLVCLFQSLGDSTTN